MDETPNDSGELPDSALPVDEPVEQESIAGEAKASVVPPAITPRAFSISAELRRPAIWGLLVLMAVVLVAQVWLLYL